MTRGLFVVLLLCHCTYSPVSSDRSFYRSTLSGRRATPPSSKSSSAAMLQLPDTSRDYSTTHARHLLAAGSLYIVLNRQDDDLHSAARFYGNVVPVPRSRSMPTSVVARSLQTMASMPGVRCDVPSKNYVQHATGGGSYSRCSRCIRTALLFQPPSYD